MKILKIKGYGHMGFHAMTCFYLANCQVLLEEGETPIMIMSDLEHTTPLPTVYHDDKDTNIWELYFDQPQYTPEQVVKESRIHYHPSLFMPPTLRQEYNNILKKHLKIKPHILEKANAFEEQYFKGHKVLGVHVRSGDLHDRPYLPFTYYKHKTDIYLEKENYTKIFVTSDQQHSIDNFKKEYGDMVIEYPTFRYPPEGSNYYIIHPEIDIRPNAGYLRGEDILIESLLLSKTDFLFKTTSNVSTFTLIYNPDLDYCDIDFYFLYNNHRYPIATNDSFYRRECKYETKEDIKSFIEDAERFKQSLTNTTHEEYYRKIVEYV